MAFSRLARLFTKTAACPASLPPGLRIYAIGDIHGRLDLLASLSEQISRDLDSAPADVVTIFLGDYVDRGKESAGVIELLSKAEFPTPFRALRGNHEEVFMKFLEDETVLESWRKFGGLETLHSYGVDVGEAMRGAGYDRARKSLAERIPVQHRRFLEQTELSADYGDYFFCHAGVRPGVPLDLQTSDDLLWIREEFLRFQGSWNKIIVHGHTPVADPDMLPNRINIDTGAFATSILTALVIEGVERRFLFARNH